MTTLPFHRRLPLSGPPSPADLQAAYIARCQYDLLYAKAGGCRLAMLEAEEALAHAQNRTLPGGSARP